MSGYRMILTDEFDKSVFFHFISGRRPNGNIATLFLEHSSGDLETYLHVRPISLRALSDGQKDGARSIMTICRQLPQSRLPRIGYGAGKQCEYAQERLKDSVDDIARAFAAAGQDMPPVTKSFLPRLRDIQPFVTILR